MADFKDYFSRQSDTYARFRPVYPPELFAYLASLTRAHDLAWDCGTGNGQSAAGLVRHYRSVYATDPSEEQIKHARPQEGITYKVEKAETPDLPDRSVDLVTVAQALHWFDFDLFYAAVKRVLKPEGIIAAWAYRMPSIDPAVDAVIRHFHDHTVGEFWKAENRLIEQGYKTIPFPFETWETPRFGMSKIMTADDLGGLLRSWSAVQQYIRARGVDPVAEVMPELTRLWGGTGEEKEARWELILKVGRV